MFTMPIKFNRNTKFKNAFSGVEKLKINYACKALVQHFHFKAYAKMGSGLRYRFYSRSTIGIEAGFEPADIIFTPNGVSLKKLSGC